jgi:hypothetical protein
MKKSSKNIRYEEMRKNKSLEGALSKTETEKT